MPYKRDPRKPSPDGMIPVRHTWPNMDICFMCTVFPKAYISSYHYQPRFRADADYLETLKGEGNENED